VREREKKMNSLRKKGFGIGQLIIQKDVVTTLTTTCHVEKLMNVVFYK
jgi:hypothetical protein